MLLPFSFLYGLGVSLRDFLYRHKLLVSVEFNIPVICVGNLSIGGAGKTPHIEYLIRLLQPYLEVATLSRGYRRKTSGYQVVTRDSNAETAGDEPLQFKRAFPGVFVAVSENRALGIPQLLQDFPQAQVVLLDDAFQHRSVLPGLNILLTEYGRPYTRDFLLPAGRLREWRSASRRADLIVVTKCPTDLTEAEREAFLRELNPFSHQRVFFSCYRYQTPFYILNHGFSVELQQDLSVLLVSAIANTDYLLGYLNQSCGTVRVREFEDHHHFSEDDLSDIEQQFLLMPGSRKIILTTSKDATRLELHRDWLLAKRLPVMVLPLEVAFLFDQSERFDQSVRAFLLNFKV